MAEETQTEKDTKKAASRVTRSGEYQARVDAAAKAKAQPTNESAKKQPTAEESRGAKNKANRTASTQRDTDRAAGRVTRSGEYQRRIDAAAEAEQVGTKQGNVDFTSASTTASSGGGDSSPLYAFKVVNDGDGTVSVTTGTVNTSTATGLTPSGKPTVLWLKVTFDTSGNVTAATVATTPGSTSATNDARQIASITWDGDTPTIVQGIKGSQSIASCGATHQWGTLYS